MWKIASQTPGISGDAGVAAEVQNLLQLNPHITNPDRIYPNEILVLGSEKINAISSPLSQSAIKQISDTWKRASPEAREIVQKNFDIIDWLSERKDEADFLDNTGAQSLHLLKRVPEINLGVIPMERFEWSIIRQDLLTVRNGTILWMKRWNVSVRRSPFFLVTATPNGLYAYSQKLSKMIELAERFKVGQRLFLLEIGLELAKTTKTAVKTKSVMETAKQAGRGGTKVIVGGVGTVVAKQICKVIVKQGPKGWIVCAAVMGVGVFGGAKAGEFLGDHMLGPARDLNLEPLP